MKLTAETAREMFHYDPETGIVTFKIDHGKRKAGDRAGCGQKGKLRTVTLGAYDYSEARLIVLVVNGEWPPEAARIKHKNGDSSDNRWSNIMIVIPPVKKKIKRSAPRPESSKTVVREIRMVMQSRKYRLTMKICGEKTVIGEFDTFKEAFVRKNEIDKERKSK